jgi:hypothetical protein
MIGLLEAAEEKKAAVSVRHPLPAIRGNFR